MPHLNFIAPVSFTVRVVGHNTRQRAKLSDLERRWLKRTRDDRRAAGTSHFPHRLAPVAPKNRDLRPYRFQPIWECERIQVEAPEAPHPEGEVVTDSCDRGGEWDALL